jgi:uncharacterized protein DUF3999
MRFGRSAAWAVVLLAWMCATTPSYAQQTTQASAFRMERPIVTNGAGPRRLPVDVPILAGTSGETLSDLRVFDASGREVPYLLVARPPAAPIWTSGTVLPVAPINTPTVKTSGFETDLGVPRVVDRFRFELPLPQSFLKRVRLEGSGDRAHWTVLVLEGTMFNLPDERLREMELAFTAGPYRYLRVTWDDTNSARLPLPSSVEARVVTALSPAPALTTALGVERRPSEPGVSRYRLRLPGGHLPVVALTFDLGGGHVLRNVSVYEARLSGTELIPVLLGTTRLQRVVQGSLSASSLDLRFSSTPHEPQLDLVVDDGDNPPLDIRGVSAVFAEQPWIYFETNGSALSARFGNPLVTAQPRYDLEAMRDALRTGITSVADATWGQTRARSVEERAGGPAPPLPTVGSTVDASAFTYVRDLPAGAPGLTALSLDAAALAHSAGAFGGFADVRVIDASSRQVPYLIERASEPLSLDLKLTPLQQRPPALASRSSLSVYRITFPFEHLPSTRIVLSTSGRVFKRALTVAVERQPGRHHRETWLETLSTFFWTHVDQDTAAPDVTVPVPSVDAKDLLLIVEEGDNAQLPITGVRLLLPSYRLRFFRDSSAQLRLAYGRRDLAPPAYDLTLLAPQVLGVTAVEIEAAGEPASRSVNATAAAVSPRFFWVTLVVAVVVLLVLIGRLLTKEQPAT